MTEERVVMVRRVAVVMSTILVTGADWSTYILDTPKREVHKGELIVVRPTGKMYNGSILKDRPIWEIVDD